MSIIPTVNISTSFTSSSIAVKNSASDPYNAFMTGIPMNPVFPKIRVNMVRQLFRGESFMTFVSGTPMIATAAKITRATTII